MIKPCSGVVGLAGVLLSLLVASACSQEAEVFGSESAVAVAEARAPGLATRALTVDHGDLPELLAQQRLRVLVPFAPPFFFFDQAEPRGITCEMFREYGKFVEEQEGLRSGDLSIVYVPCELGLVVPWLNAGYGDIAAAALTVTPEREAEVAFTDALVEGVSEILVTSSSAPPLGSLDELAGRQVWVTAGSSYTEHLRALSDDLVARDLAAIEVLEAPATLSTEDLFEMVNAGILQWMVSDDYKAELWAGLLTELRPRPDLVVHEGGALAWAVRRDNPELRANLNEFVGRARKGTLLGNILIKRYFSSTRWIEDPNDTDSAEKLERYALWMRELGEEYGFDWLRLAAQCFQESGLDPAAESSSGALGLMQLLPSTAEDMDCADPLDPEQNLRAGVRYLDWLRTNFFADPGLAEDERMDFILAAYNAGPGNVRKWREQAPERGLDPDRWRDNVERLALESVGIQPLRYVDNIEKYYVAYSLAQDLRLERRRQMGQER